MNYCRNKLSQKQFKPWNCCILMFLSILGSTAIGQPVEGLFQGQDVSLADNRKTFNNYAENTSALSREATISVTSAEASNDRLTLTATQFGMQAYATLPYSSGFESGSLDQYWLIQNDHPNGQVQVTTQYGPHSGTYHLVMFADPVGVIVQNEAWLHLNLSAYRNVRLTFWWKDFGDEDQSGEGVYFSDDAGNNFVLVQELVPSLYPSLNWRQFELDLDSLAQVSGLTLSETFVVRFVHIDDFKPNTDGFAFDDILVESLEVQLSAKVWLEGAYDVAGDTMSAYLANNGLLPLNQPFNGPPWNYDGPDTVTAMPAGAVDWVLAELRSGQSAASTVARQAGLLLKDGMVVGLDGSSPVNIPTDDGDYYIVLRHRNHLDLMSTLPHTLTRTAATLYDFTSSQGQAFGGNPMNELETNVFGMIAGDGNADGSTSNADRDDVWRLQNGTSWDYSKLGDFNLDGGINALDINLFWRLNIGRSTQFPD